LVWRGDTTEAREVLFVPADKGSHCEGLRCKLAAEELGECLGALLRGLVFAGATEFFFKLSLEVGVAL
jgi:hypothetical protein